MADRVLIDSLVVETVVGVYDWERAVTQRLEIDLDMAWDNRVPGQSDDVADALDYAAVSDRVSQWLIDLQPQLLERAAEVVAQRLMAEFGVASLVVTIRKPGAVPAARSVGVRIERSRNQKGEQA
ncbi:dihydroneopterin aldolase [Marinobacter sp. C2H3]|uniref:dihydroneopterin aldolase n=1 Tax=Marinobacter sp. C2H3 TaxID=3119003 RepID=UPI00300EE510